MIKNIDWFIAGIMGFVIFLLTMIVYLSIQEQKEWHKFSTLNNCKLVAHKKGQLQTGYGLMPTTSGSGMVMTVSHSADQEAYLCDDGVTYWRDK